VPNNVELRNTGLTSAGFDHYFGGCFGCVGVDWGQSATAGQQNSAQAVSICSGRFSGQSVGCIQNI